MKIRLHTPAATPLAGKASGQDFTTPQKRVMTEKATDATFGLMSSGDPRILIVDDEPGIRKLLSSVFNRAGYEVRVASSGMEAAKICESETFDVLLSDVIMPGEMNGHDLVRWLMKRQPETHRILMSSFDSIRCEGCGQAPTPCSLVKKPFVPRELVALVDAVVRGPQPVRAN